MGLTTESTQVLAIREELKSEIVCREEGPFSALTSSALMASAIIHLAIKHCLLIQRNISNVCCSLSFRD